MEGLLTPNLKLFLTTLQGSPPSMEQSKRFSRRLSLPAQAGASSQLPADIPRDVEGSLSRPRWGGGGRFWDWAAPASPTAMTRAGFGEGTQSSQSNAVTEAETTPHSLLAPD